MQQLASYVVFALLAAIAVELLVLIGQTRALARSLESSSAKKEGQTINVNVAAPQAQEAAGQAKAIVAENASAPQAQAAQAADRAAEPGEPSPEGAESEPPIEPEPPRPPPPKPVFGGPGYSPAAKVSASGQIVTKCPSCQAENSSYRDQCFNCGAALR
jgi:hypothetical protein